MKKNQMTMITSAILSMAAATAGVTSSSSQPDNVNAMAGVYGPPPSYINLNGDVNNDNSVNIIDICMMKNMTEGGTSGSSDPMVYDVNKDGVVDSLDFRAVRNYFLGITQDITDKDPDPLITTAPEVTTSEITYQTTYGPPPTAITEEPIYQTKYGPPWIFTDSPVTEVPSEVTEVPPEVLDYE